VKILNTVNRGKIFALLAWPTLLHDHGIGAFKKSFNRSSAVQPQQARKGFQRGRLARAVGAQHRDQLAFLDGERNSFQSVYGAVVDVNVLNLEHLPPTFRAPSKLL
jgi:hypothetical protein